MSEKAMQCLEQILGENADKLNKEEKAFINGYVTRAVQEAEEQTAQTDNKEAE